MSKKLQLHIPTPCHENWDKMTPVERGRFCGSCQKQVVDFTNMSDREIAMFFKKPILSQSKDGSVCGRFMQDQLDRNIEIPKKRIPWLKYFFQFVLPAFLVSARATAQGKVRVKENVTLMEKIFCSKNQEPNLNSNPTPIKIAESIKMDASDFPTYTIRGQVSLRLGGVSVKTNNEPKYILDGTPLKNSQELKDIHAENIENIAILKNDVSVALYGEVGAVVLITTKKPKQNLINNKSNKVKINQRQLNKNDIFKVFPNPINSGTTLNIQWKKSETCTYKLELFNLSGQLIFSKDMWIDEEARSLSVEIPRVAAGNYFLRMTSKTSAKSYTEKIIVQ